MAFNGDWSQFDDWLKVSGTGGYWPDSSDDRPLPEAQQSVVKSNASNNRQFHQI